MEYMGQIWVIWASAPLLACIGDVYMGRHQLVIWSTTAGMVSGRTLVVVDKEVDEEGVDKDEMVVMKESMWG